MKVVNIASSIFTNKSKVGHDPLNESCFIAIFLVAN